MLKDKFYAFERIFGSHLTEKQRDSEYRKWVACYGAAMLGGGMPILQKRHRLQCAAFFPSITRNRLIWAR